MSDAGAGCATFAAVDEDSPLRPAPKAPSRPWGWERAFWFHMPQSLRRAHYGCCWLPQAAFNREDVEHGNSGSWWMPKESSRRAQ